jgi:hypothetical protein
VDGVLQLSDGRIMVMENPPIGQFALKPELSLGILLPSLLDFSATVRGTGPAIFP